jgi:microcystin-dependent protein
MGCSNCDDCENFCTSEITCVDANFTNISVGADATLNDVLEAFDATVVSVVGATGPQGPVGPTGAAGANGTNGTNGTAGTAGARGNAGSNCVIWDSSGASFVAGGFDAESIDTNFQSVTAWNFNKTSKLGYSGTNGTFGNAALWLSAISAGDILQIHQVDDSTKFGIYTVQQSYYYNPIYTFSVSVLVASSTFDANKQYTVSFVKKGDSATTPVGSVQMYAGDFGAPAGWLLCNGNAVSRATYASLFGTIGTVFGAGNGTTTFNLPNLQGRVPVGVGTIPDTLGTVNLGATGGNSLKQINAQELPQHTHPINDPGHQHNVVANNSPTITAGINPAQATVGNLGTSNPTLLANTNTTGITVGNNVSTNTAISLMQPYIGLNFIIKY